MAELTFKSAGVSTREIDLSGPTPTGPVGIPAGIIGTSLQGPAFVPLTFASFSEFITTFGNTDGEKFGPLAVYEWLKNAQACTYIRILGAGDGKQRNTTTGIVNNAGFIVGGRTVQDGGTLTDNAAANNGAGGMEGRTYFLGCLMSESNGSTIFSDAGIQDLDTRANVEFTMVQYLTGSTTITSPSGRKVCYSFHTGTLQAPTFSTDAAGIFQATVASRVSAGANQSAAVLAAELAGAITSSNGHGSEFTVNVTGAKVMLTASIPGIIGNTPIAHGGGQLGYLGVHAVSQSFATSFSGGSGGAVPILRGVVMAPSGVILHLSGNANASNMTGDWGYTESTVTARTNDAVGSMGRYGGVTGSVDLKSQEFVMFMNGFKGSSDKPMFVTASFDMTQPNYFANVFNADPLKIEEEGHLLYTHYDVHPNLAAVTGSGTLRDGKYSKGSALNHEDLAFLLSGSLNRNVGSSTIPNYEGFDDRFAYAETPFITSQKYGNTPYDLFKVVALSAGDEFETKYKFSIENIKKSTSDTYQFGRFDLLVRRLDDIDEEKAVVESFRGLSLDTTSDRYIGRVIGDQNVFYNFDTSETSQKLVVDGTHPVNSRYIRVVLSDALKKNEVPDGALPVGYRGPRHLVTSGALLATENDPLYLHQHSSGTLLQRLREPPIPYRETITKGTGEQKRVDRSLCWGIQTVRKTSATKPNQPGMFESAFKSFAKYFPNHRLDALNVSVGRSTSVNGTTQDSDSFNNNQFTLENIRVTTSSNADGKADPELWHSASYVRAGGISANTTNYTRAFSVDDLEKVGNIQFAKFTFFAQGGFNGTNIFDKDKSKFTDAAAKREIDDNSAQGGTSGPTVAAYRKAIDIMGSKTDVDIQLLAIPGARNTAISDYAINAVEDRFDAMYIMDVEERDIYNQVITASADQQTHVGYTVTAFKNRALDSSFAAAYFPDVTVIDPEKKTQISVPPSVAVLGAYSVNDRIGHPWFAPAGFTRGALSGVEVAAVKLNRTNLDDLYEADINPITAFPGTGITIWGQKTLQAADSALDRVNVRRLLINIRRKVRNIANSLLFEPNREETLDRFSALVNPILQRIQEQSGVDRYKVVIDTTTTTQKDVENNTIRGKIFLQPTRSVEFISLDFVVTNAGSNI